LSKDNAKQRGLLDRRPLGHFVREDVLKRLAQNCHLLAMVHGTIISGGQAGREEDLWPIVGQYQPMGANCWQWRYFLDAGG